MVGPKGYSLTDRVYYTLAVWRSKQFLSGGCGYIHIYLVVYGPEIIGGFSLLEKTTEVCGL